MATLIKSNSKIITKSFNVDDTVTWVTLFHDGRSYEKTNHIGKIIKVNPVNLIVVDLKGNTWKVSKNEVLG